jgi:hypothetical protein
MKLRGEVVRLSWRKDAEGGGGYGRAGMAQKAGRILLAVSP